MHENRDQEPRMVDINHQSLKAYENSLITRTKQQK